MCLYAMNLHHPYPVQCVNEIVTKTELNVHKYKSKHCKSLLFLPHLKSIFEVELNALKSQP